MLIPPVINDGLDDTSWWGSRLLGGDLARVLSSASD